MEGGKWKKSLKLRFRKTKMLVSPVCINKPIHLFFLIQLVKESAFIVTFCTAALRLGEGMARV